MPSLLYTTYMSSGKQPGAMRRQEHILGRQLLSRGLERFFGLSLSGDTLEEALVRTEKGKPVLRDYPGVCFNISHCSGLVLCAFDTLAIGADAELPERPMESLAGKILSEPEKTYLSGFPAESELRRRILCRFWTLKEAYAKRSGAGLSHGFTSVSFTLPFKPQDEGALPDPAGTFFSVPCSDKTVACKQLTADTGHIISVCLTGEERTVSFRYEAIPLPACPS